MLACASEGVGLTLALRLGDWPGFRPATGHGKLCPVLGKGMRLDA
jgi:hypothetical protein